MSVKNLCSYAGAQKVRTSDANASIFRRPLPAPAGLHPHRLLTHQHRHRFGDGDQMGLARRQVHRRLDRQHPTPHRRRRSADEIRRRNPRTIRHRQGPRPPRRPRLDRPSLARSAPRAWLRAPLPVRNREQINRMRSALTHHLITTQGHTTISTQVDLAFDY